jgi:hypothetical protein
MKTTNIHRKIFTNNSPFAAAAVTALVVGVADVIAVVADLVWLGGDIIHSGLAPHHAYVGTMLTVALIALVASFIWLYRSIISFIAKKEKVGTYKAFFGVLAYDEVKHDHYGYIVENKKSKKTPYVYRETTD